MVQEKRALRECARRKQLASLRVHMIGVCVELADLMLQSAQIASIFDAVGGIERRLEALHSPLFVVNVSLTESGILLNPGARVFSETLTTLWQELISQADSMPTLACNNQFQHCVCAKDRRSIEGVLAASNNFSFRTKRIEGLLLKQLLDAQSFANKVFEPCLQIYEYGSNFDEGTYSSLAYTREDLSLELYRLRDFKVEIGKIKLNAAVGALNVNAEALRNEVMRIHDSSLVVIL